MSDNQEHHEQLQQLLEAAEKHGQDGDPEHEVGDLADMLYACWEAMTPAQRTSVYESYREYLDLWR